MTKIAEAASILKLLNREIWVVTSASSGRKGGLTATWVSAASIDIENPTLLAGIGPNHFTAELIDESGVFAAHLLRRNQTELALRFALESSRTFDKFTAVSTSAGRTGAPLLEDSLAWMDCRVYSRLATGDRNYYFADVVAAQQRGTDPPMTEQDLIRAATPAQKEQLARGREIDVERQRPHQQKFRGNLPVLLAPK